MNSVNSFNKKFSDKTVEGITDRNMILSKDLRISVNGKCSHDLDCIVVDTETDSHIRNFVEPNVLQMNSSYVIDDPTGEVFRVSAKMLLERWLHQIIYHALSHQKGMFRGDSVQRNNFKERDL